MITPFVVANLLTQFKPPPPRTVHEAGVRIVKIAPAPAPIQPLEAKVQPEVVINTPPPVETPQAAPEQPTGSVQDIIVKWANTYGVNPQQLLRVAKCESGFDIYAHNVSGATGLFQFMPPTFYGNGGTDLYSADDQAKTAAKMFSKGQAGQWECK